MVLTALIGLAILGAIISWDRQLPQEGERWTALSTKRRAYTVLGIPVGLGAAAVSAALLSASADAEGFYPGLTALSAAGAGLGGLWLAGLTGFRFVRSRREASPHERARG